MSKLNDPCNILSRSLVTCNSNCTIFIFVLCSAGVDLGLHAHSASALLPSCVSDPYLRYSIESMEDRKITRFEILTSSSSVT